MIKKIFLLLLASALWLSGVAQTYLATQHTTISKPMGANGFPVDARTYFYDATNFKYRAYVSTTEVKTYLATSANRTGATVVVNTGGTLLNGVITGGTNAEWWFKDGTADNNLVLKTIAATDTTSLSDRINLKADKSITVNGHALSGNVTVTKSDVSLGNADNTSDANKPISTATQAALDAKQNSIGFTPENTANKTSTSSNSATTYPNWYGITHFSYPKSHTDSLANGTLPFTAITVDGASQTIFHKTGGSAGSAIKGITTASSITSMLDISIENTTGDVFNWHLIQAPPPTGYGTADINLTWPNQDGDMFTAQDLNRGTLPAWLTTLKLDAPATATGTNNALVYDAATGIIKQQLISGGGGSGTYFKEVPSGSINSSNTTFTLSHTPISNTFSVFRNGQMQIPSVDYTISGTTITYLFAPASGNTLYVTYSY